MGNARSPTHIENRPSRWLEIHAGRPPASAHFLPSKNRGFSGLPAAPSQNASQINHLFTIRWVIFAL